MYGLEALPPGIWSTGRSSRPEGQTNGYATFVVRSRALPVLGPGEKSSKDMADTLPQGPARWQMEPTKDQSLFF